MSKARQSMEEEKNLRWSKSRRSSKATCSSRL